MISKLILFELLLVFGFAAGQLLEINDTNHTYPNLSDNPINNGFTVKPIEGKVIDNPWKAFYDPHFKNVYGHNYPAPEEVSEVQQNPENDLPPLGGILDWGNYQSEEHYSILGGIFDSWKVAANQKNQAIEKVKDSVLQTDMKIADTNKEYFEATWTFKKHLLKPFISKHNANNEKHSLFLSFGKFSQIRLNQNYDDISNTAKDTEDIRE